MKQLHTPPLGARAIASEGSAGAGTPTLVIVGLGLFIALLDATIVNIALPAMMKDFGIGITQVSWVLNAYNLAFVTLLLTGGKLADQFGRRRMYLLGVLGFVALSVACALAPNAGWLIAFRALQGLAGALLVPATLALVVAAFPRERLGVGIGAWSAIGALASALGPALGGIITQTLSWRWIFWVNLPVGLAALGLAVQFLKESRDPTTESHIDFLGILTISAGLFGLSLALIQAGDWGWRSPRFLSLLIGATLAVIAWIVVESHARMPMVDLGIFHNQTFSAGTSVMFAVGFGMITAIFFVPQFLVNISGFSEVNAGLAITPTPLVVMVVGGFVAGRLYHRIGPRVPTLIGVLLAAAGLLSLSTLRAGGGWKEVFLPLAILGAGIGLALIPAGTAAMDALPPAGTGVASGVLTASRQIGIIFGVAVLVAILNSQLSNRTSSTKSEMRFAVLNSSLPPPIKEVMVGRLSAIGNLNDSEAVRKLLSTPLPDGLPPALRPEMMRVGADLRKAVKGGSTEAFDATFRFGAAGVLLLGLVPSLFLKRPNLVRPRRVSASPSRVLPS